MMERERQRDEEKARRGGSGREVKLCWGRWNLRGSGLCKRSLKVTPSSQPQRVLYGKACYVVLSCAGGVEADTVLYAVTVLAG